MKVKIELFGAARDFSEQNLLELDLDQKSTIKDIRKKIIQYLDQKFNGNENYKSAIEPRTIIDNTTIDEINVNLLNSICHDLSENGDINKILYLLNFIKLIRLN